MKKIKKNFPHMKEKYSPPSLTIIFIFNYFCFPTLTFNLLLIIYPQSKNTNNFHRMNIQLNLSIGSLTCLRWQIMWCLVADEVALN